MDAAQDDEEEDSKQKLGLDDSPDEEHHHHRRTSPPPTPRAIPSSGSRSTLSAEAEQQLSGFAIPSSPLIPPKSIVISPPPREPLTNTSTTIKTAPMSTTLQSSFRKHRRGDSRSSLRSVVKEVNDDDNNDPQQQPQRVLTVPPPPPPQSDNFVAREASSDNVSELEELTDDDSDREDDAEITGRPLDAHDLQRRMSRNVFRRESDGHVAARYAVKRLRDHLTEKVRLDAVIDLACEAEFLKRISHSNIVRLRAVVGQPGTLDYALVLDRLTTTLIEKMAYWRENVKQCRGNKWWGGLFGRRSDTVKLDRMLTDRLLVSFDIARALQHLRRMKVLYRDLKPENIGKQCVSVLLCLLRRNSFDSFVLSIYSSSYLPACTYVRSYQKDSTCAVTASCLISGLLGN